jgi:hypothetical protein
MRVGIIIVGVVILGLIFGIFYFITGNDSENADSKNTINDPEGCIDYGIEISVSGVNVGAEFSKNLPEEDAFTTMQYAQDNVDKVRWYLNGEKKFDTNYALFTGRGMSGLKSGDKIEVAVILKDGTICDISSSLNIE